MKKKLLITGGHLAPALVLIDYLIEKKKLVEIIFVGRQYNLEDDREYSLEYQEIKRRKIRFISFFTGRLKRELSFDFLKNLFFIFYGVLKAYWIIKKEKPTMIFSFGSYLGFPLVFIGWIKKIPVYIHEQTIAPGLANRVSGLFAKKIFVAFPEAAKFFNKKKVVISGNPVRKEIFQIIKKPLIIKKNKPVIYVTGGSLGSHSLNQHMLKILPSLLKMAIVIHQTGSVRKYNDYQKLSVFRESLPLDLKKNYFIRKHFYSDEIGYIFSLADLVVSRAGANTFFELISLKKPAILVPLPWSANKEQEKQAILFSQAGLGEIFYQNKKSDYLLALIKKMINSLDKYKDQFKNCQFKTSTDAIKIIEEKIFNY